METAWAPYDLVHVLDFGMFRGNFDEDFRFWWECRDQDVIVGKVVQGCAMPFRQSREPEP